MRPYQGPQVDPVTGFPLREDAKRRIMWEGLRDDYGNWIVPAIKVQVFRLSNGTILQARSEIEAGAYLNKGAELVDTIYHDENIEFNYEAYQDPEGSDHGR